MGLVKGEFVKVEARLGLLGAAFGENGTAGRFVFRATLAAAAGDYGCIFEAWDGVQKFSHGRAKVHFKRLLPPPRMPSIEIAPAPKKINANAMAHRVNGNS